MSYKNILFDLDGTLIDSAPGIEESFYEAYMKVYNVECPQIITTFIGPPIDQVLTAVNREGDLNTIKHFTDAFKQHYDTEGYKKSKLYDDVKWVLDFLLENKLDFAFVEYGYGQYESSKYKLNNIKQIINFL